MDIRPIETPCGCSSGSLDGVGVVGFSGSVGLDGVSGSVGVGGVGSGLSSFESSWIGIVAVSRTL